eukprot:CAMPEP_0181505258 /NCGR_PEP_ID=MMETSP1110-20121109/57960_1 /TAXON_ID=174948 /ORGANISM="Symbiodinium sp., Strain CCMP421" /LENGTH=84 /DNA_ID=CAMNT_0023634227 /DNA_START=142 /DNA_END=393 /DNA_ORIENTATION=+
MAPGGHGAIAPQSGEGAQAGHHLHHGLRRVRILRGLRPRAAALWVAPGDQAPVAGEAAECAGGAVELYEVHVFQRLRHLQRREV